MQYALAPLALAAIVAALPQASTSSECSENYPGTFQIQVVNQTDVAKRSAFEKRQSTPLEISLKDGVLTDAQGRVGSIVANQQFQFDPAPGQPDAVYTSGWSVCNNGSLSIGGDSTFYQCLSGTFYNLYDQDVADQCSPVYIEAINGAGSASQVPDGQVTATQVASQMPDGQITASAVAPVTQISDGQLQAPTGAPVTQISDGQIQAPTSTGSPVTQISDGQIQAPTGTPVTQISDGQIQAPTGTPVSQIADGQIQAPTGNGTVSKAPSATYSAPAEYTGAASHVGAGLFGLAGAALVAML